MNFPDKYKKNYLQNTCQKTFNHFYLWLLGGSLLLTACGKKVEIKDFDQVAWRQDGRSCNNIRPRLVPKLEAAIPQLIGLTHNEIIQILGKPEGNSLEKSGERVYYYYIQPGNQCDQNLPAPGNRLLIRIDALDRVYKVRQENTF